MSLPCASLILKSSTLFGTTDLNTSQNVMTFRHLNLPLILGPHLFDKYEKFNIHMAAFSAAYNDTGLGPTNDIETVYMSGLQFAHSTYDVASKGETISACMGIVPFTDANAVHETFNDNNKKTFTKTSAFFDLTVTLKTVYDDSVLGGVVFPFTQFHFIITPCLEP